MNNPLVAADNKGVVGIDVDSEQDSGRRGWWR
jgi:hypothetical protein